MVHGRAPHRQCSGRARPVTIGSLGRILAVATRDRRADRSRRATLVARVVDWLRGSPRGAPAVGVRRVAEPDGARATPPVRAQGPANTTAADQVRAERLAALAARQAARARTRKRIEYEDKIVHRTHLDASLLLLLKELRDWPARSQRGVLAEGLPFDAQDVSAQERHSPDLTAHSVEFTFQGTRYRVEVDINAERSFGGRTGKLRFLQNGKAVLSAHLSGPADGTPVHWDRLKVDALEPGPWVGHVGEIEEQIRFASERHVLQQELARLMGEDDDPGKRR